MICRVAFLLTCLFSSAPSTYVEAAQIGQPVSRSKTPPVLEKLPEHKPGELCPYAAQGECRYGEMCTYVHGEMCEMCGKQALHPSDKELRDKHTKVCTGISTKK